MQKLHLPKAKMRLLKKKRDVALNDLGKGAIIVHWPRCLCVTLSIFLWCFYNHLPREFAGLHSVSLRRRTSGLNCAWRIGLSVRQHHGCPVWLASPYNSSAQLRWFTPWSCQPQGRHWEAASCTRQVRCAVQFAYREVLPNCKKIVFLQLRPILLKAWQFPECWYLAIYFV